MLRAPLMSRVCRRSGREGGGNRGVISQMKAGGRTKNIANHFCADRETGES